MYFFQKNILIRTFYCSLWNYPGSKKPRRSDFTFPNRLTDIKLKLSDRGYLIADTLGPFVGVSGYFNPIMRQYHQDLRTKKLVNDDFNQFISASGGQTYNQLLFVDLRAYKLKERSTLTVETQFQGDNPCPGNLYLVCCAVKEGVIKRRNDEWFMNYVAP